jgi:hypothetical protein
MLNTITGYKSNDLDLYSNNAYATPKTMKTALEALTNNQNTINFTKGKNDIKSYPSLAFI